MHVGWHGTHGNTTLRDNGMNADGVFIAVCLTLGVDGGHGNHGGVQRVDILMWRPASMRRPAKKANMFGDDVIVRAIIGNLAVFCLGAGGVRHHGEIDVIEGTFSYNDTATTEKF